MKSPSPADRQQALMKEQALKMARSPHAYMRGNTIKFYEWLARVQAGVIPEGPAIWICGDCHVGNLGPVGDSKGRVSIEIRDLDQTVIGNPAHDMLRLGLSLVTAARGSDLPGITMARMLEHFMEGYAEALAGSPAREAVDVPEPVLGILHRSLHRRWKNLAEERLEDMTPEIPKGRRFWPLDERERTAIAALCAGKEIRELVTKCWGRRDDASLKVVDAAYWVKGCSSLGRLRYAVLLRVKDGRHSELCLLDLKEAAPAAAPRSQQANRPLPEDSAERVVMGARALSPYLGDRMAAVNFLGKPVVARELLPQDLKIEIDQLTRQQACKVAKYLANVVGRAHARQMDAGERRQWRATLQERSLSSLDAPSWFWTSIVDLLGVHEVAYLEHCRRFALPAKGRAPAPAPSAVKESILKPLVEQPTGEAPS
jgi:uncharacterized protein (DUF2252 family)